MSSIALADEKQESILAPCQDFLPVNDEYRPFAPMKSRDLRQSRLEVPLMVRALRLPKYQRVLEIGCGAGKTLESLAVHCEPIRLAGIDIDGHELEEAEKHLRKHGVRASLYQEDVRRLPFPDESFDIVIDFGTTYHINRRVKALKEIERVLAKGGIFAYETRLNQLLSHPIRSLGHHVPWQNVRGLQPRSAALLWSSRVKARKS